MAFIFDESIETRLGKAIDRDFSWTGLNVTKYFSTPPSTNSHDLLVHFTDWNSAESLKAEKFPNSNFIVESNEAYALLWDGNKVYAASDTEAGHFYALQTLRQMLPEKNWPKGSNTFALSSADVLDQPSLRLRGVVFGKPNFNINEQLIPRVSRFKGNSILLPGAGFSNRVSNEWRIPLKSTDVQDLISFVNLSKDYFIQPIFGIAPRGKKTSGVDGVWIDPAVEYSSSSEVDLAVIKLVEGYNAGFRHFLMNYNDLANYGGEQDTLTYASDIATYETALNKENNILGESWGEGYNSLSNIDTMRPILTCSGILNLPTDLTSQWGRFKSLIYDCPLETALTTNLGCKCT